jgi:hypothetical protein
MTSTIPHLGGTSPSCERRWLKTGQNMPDAGTNKKTNYLLSH